MAKTYAAQGTTLTPLLAKVDGGSRSGRSPRPCSSGTDAKTALQTLQTALDALNK